MASKDIYGGGNFGAIAGSLLSQRRSGFKKAIGVSVIENILGQLNLSNKEESNNNIIKTEKEMQQVFNNNDEIWNIKKGERDLWRGYQSATRRGNAALDSFINTEAIKRFNADSHIQSEMGLNAYNTLQGDNWTEQSKEKALSFFEDIKSDLVTEIEGYRDDKAITAPTKTKFNQAAYDELDARLAMYEDDPKQQGVILNMFGNIFGKNQQKRAELTRSLNEAKRIRAQQEDTYEGVTYDEKNNIVVAQVTDTLREKFDFITTKEDVARQQKTIRTKIQSEGYQPTVGDVRQAFSLGVNPTNIKALSDLQANDLPLFVETFTMINNINKRMPNLDATDYLDPRQLDIYDTAMGITREGVNLQAAIADEKQRTSVVSSILNRLNNITEEQGTGTKDDDEAIKLKLINGDFTIGEANEDTSTGQSGVFVTNVLKAAEILKKKYDVPEADVLQVAYEMQLRGISMGTGGTEEQPNDIWSRNDPYVQTHSVEFVNPDVEMVKLLPETAGIVANNINTNLYMQRENEYKAADGTMKDYTPLIGKTFNLGDKNEDQDFYVTFDVIDKNPQTGVDIDPKWVATVKYK